MKAFLLVLVFIPSAVTGSASFAKTASRLGQRNILKIFGGGVACGGVAYEVRAASYDNKTGMSRNRRPICDAIGYAWNPSAMDALGEHLENELEPTPSLPNTPLGGICPYDDHLFAWNPSAMDALGEYLENELEPTPSLLNTPLGGICPHDDHLFAGSLYYPLFKKVKAKHFVIFGVFHGGAAGAVDEKRNAILLDTHDEWEGTYNPVGISDLREKIIEEMPDEYVVVSDEAHRQEYSIEAMIPFMQYFQRNVVITPIIVPTMDFEKMNDIAEVLSDVIAHYMEERHLIPGKDIFFLCSSDSSHYGSDFKNTFYGEGIEGYNLAVAADLEATQHLTGKLTPERIKSFAEEGVVVRGWCGRYSVPFGTLTMQKTFKKIGIELEGDILHYSDTLSKGVIPLPGTFMGVTAPFNLDHWVGHLSVLYYKTPSVIDSSEGLQNVATQKKGYLSWNERRKPPGKLKEMFHHY